MWILLIVVAIPHDGLCEGVQRSGTRQTMVREAKVRLEKCLRRLANHRCSAYNQRMCSGDKGVQEHRVLLFIEAELFVV